MSENGRKRSRKSKLVPRDCGDDDCFLQEPPKKKTLLEKIKSDGVCMSASTAPLQFSVKVEVEDINNPSEEDPSDYMQYLFSLSTSTPENTESTVPTPTVTTTNDTTTARKSLDEIDPPESPEDTVPYDETAYYMNQTKMFKMFSLLNKMYPNDKEAVMHCRNLWGKVFHELGYTGITLTDQEKELHNVMMEWRTWQVTSKSRDTPFSYKCYICSYAWWSYNEFSDHIRCHPAASLKLEIFHQESNIIAYQVVSPTHKKIYVDGKCLKCAKTFLQHEENRNSTDDLYFCVHCNDKFLTCTALLKHEGTCGRNPARPSIHETLNMEIRVYPCKVCAVVFLSKPAQLEHLNVCHTVRSDDPIATGSKICKVCKKVYHLYHVHVCPKKNILHECIHCQAKFQSKSMLDSHFKSSNQSISCTLCKIQLQKSCMAPEHYARHSENFQIMYRCIPCKKIKLFNSLEAIRQHRLKNHSKITIGRRPVSDKIPVPKIMIEKCIDTRHKKHEGGYKRTYNRVEHNTVNLYTKAKGKNYRHISRRNTEENRTDEEEDVDVESNDVDEEIKNKLEKLNQITESIDIEPDVVVKEEPLSDEEDVKPDVSQVFEEAVASLIEMDEFVEKCTSIKQEPLEAEKETDVQKSDDTQKQATEQVTEEKENKDTDEVLKTAVKVEKAEPEETKKEKNVTEGTKTKRQVYQTQFEVYYPDKVVKYAVKLPPLVPISRPKPKPKPPVLEKPPENLQEKTQPRILNTEIANNVVSESILDPVVELEIKPELDGCDNDLIVFSSSHDIKKETSVNSDSSAELSLLNLEPEVILNAGYRKRKVYRCSRCDYSGYHREYREHVNFHCDVPIRERPIKNDTPGVTYTCTKCDTAFPCLKKYALHFVHHGYERMACPQCSLVFDTLTRLMPHINSHIKNQFLRVQQIDTLDEKNSRSYQCKTCKDVIDMANSFVHWEVHLELNPQKIKGGSVVEEKQTAKGTYVLEPDTMKRILATLQQHNVPKTGTQPKIKCCFVCHRIFERQNDCKRHLIEHLLEDALAKISETSKLQCQICKELSNNVDAYKKHMRDHAALPIYQCFLCNKSFSDSSNFTKHKKIHNMKAFVCDICNKKFQVKSSLERHIQIHMVTDPYKCESCQKLFYDIALYKRHIRTNHEKPRYKHKCIICRAKFDSLRLKWDHLWIVHKQRKEEADCPICKKKFRKVLDVKKHCMDEHLANMTILKMLGDVKRENDSDKDSDDDVLVIEEETETLVILDDDNDNRTYNRVEHNTVNLYTKAKGKNYRHISRRNTEENRTDEEEDVDVESNDVDEEIKNKLEKLNQITESIDIEPDVVVKEEPLSDEEDVKPDVSQVFEEAVASLIEMDEFVEKCTSIKQEPLEAEKETDVQKSDDTQKQATEQVTEEKENKDTDEVLKTAVKVEKAEPEETKKEKNVTEGTKTKRQVYQTQFEVYYPDKVVKYAVKLPPLVPISRPKPKPKPPVLEKPPENLQEKTQPRILNTEIANNVVSESILDPVVELEIKPELDGCDNDLIVFSSSHDIKKETSVNSDSSAELSLLNLEPEVILNAGYRKRKVYRCSRCDYSGYHREYREHVNFHCDVPIRERPIKNDTPGVTYTCTKCDTAFPCLKKYALHFVHHGYERMACPQCSLVFDTLTRLMPHINSHIKNQFLRVQQIDTLDEKNSRSYQCKTCKDVIDMANSFVHWEVHLELNPQKIKGGSVVEEKQTAKGTYVLEPDTMKRILATLQQHNVPKTGTQPKIKCCFVCHRIFERQNDCKRHLIEHLLEDALAKISETSKLQCQICKELSNNVDAYKKHMRDHAALPIYQCFLCNKSFSDSSNFTKHKKIHNMKAFVCDICNKKFQVKSSLERHIQIHMVTDPYKCESCQKLFYDIALYKRHIRTNHEKPRYKHKCIICRAKFDSLRLKWDHLWIVHKQRKEEADCPICKKKFRKVLDVKKHCMDEHLANMTILKMLGDVKRENDSDKDSDDDVLVIEEETETLVILDDDNDNS